MTDISDTVVLYVPLTYIAPPRYDVQSAKVIEVNVKVFAYVP